MRVCPMCGNRLLEIRRLPNGIGPSGDEWRVIMRCSRNHISQSTVVGEYSNVGEYDLFKHVVAVFLLWYPEAEFDEILHALLSDGNLSYPHVCDALDRYMEKYAENLGADLTDEQRQAIQLLDGMKAILEALRMGADSSAKVEDLGL